MQGNAAKLVFIVSVFCLLTWIFVWGARVGRAYELVYFVVSAIVVGALIRWFWPDSKRLSLAELQPCLKPLGWGVGIAAILLMAGLLAERWKFVEYLIVYVAAPVPLIALFFVIRWRAK